MVNNEYPLACNIVELQSTPKKRTFEDLEDIQSSSPCTISTSSSPSTSPPYAFLPNPYALLWQQSFIPNHEVLMELLEIGVPLEGAKRALFYTGNCSLDMALRWLKDGEQDLETPVEEEIESIKEMLRYNIENGSMSELMQDVSSDISDVCEELEISLVIVINHFIGLTRGQMALASSKATARVMVQAKDAPGMDMLSLWDQCGRQTTVRAVSHSEELEDIANLILDSEEISKSIFMDWVELSDKWCEKKVLALFGDIDDINEYVGHLPCFA